MIEQIKQALDEANLPYEVSKDTGDLLDSNGDTVADFIYHEEDIHLIANAPEWLRYLISEVERLEKQLTYFKCLDCSPTDFEYCKPHYQSRTEIWSGGDDGHY